MSKVKRIALALPLGVPHLEEVVHGIRLYGLQQRDWDFVTSPETHSIPVSSLKGWDGHGVIGMISSMADLKVVEELTCPFVNLSGALEKAPLPRVRVDYTRAGEMAAEHLLSRGFERFAFYGLKNTFFAESCLDGFRKRLEPHRMDCAVYEDTPTFGVAQPWLHNRAGLEKWLRSLKTPVGLMASHDPRAVMIVQACRRVGLRVPEDVAVIGFNNDIQSCEFCDPQLTSIARPGARIGREAAALLDRLLRGEAPPAGDILFQPEGVVERASTNTVAVGDNPELAEAVRYIHQHLAESIGVEDIIRHINVSRRWLEMAFRDKLHTSPHAFISQARVKKARSLLAGPRKMRFKQVALECGFNNTRQLSLVFERHAGMTLREFIARNHPNAAAPEE